MPPARRWGRQASLLVVLLPALTLLAPTADATWIDLGGASTAVNLIESNPQRTVLEITVGGFDAVAVTINGRIHYRIHLPGESLQREKGFPALPDVRRSLIIPDDRRVVARLLSSEYRDFPDMPVAPSRGHLPRSIDPATVPYRFDAFYEGNGVYPAEPITGHAPYILRDFRGMVVDANAFQYFPATQTLRVYTRMLIEVVPAGPGNTNVLERRGPIAAMDSQFAKLYESHFINFDQDRYDPLLEDGSILIITYDAFRPFVEPLYEWKLQKGIVTRLVDVSEVGSTPTEIKAYVRTEFETTDLAYVLLVGDAPQIPTFIHSEGGADPQYALMGGLDCYPDLFVGRFSAETAEEVATQVARTIAYERDPVTGENWPQYGTGIASDQGPGHYGEYDNEHMEYIREDLLVYGYSDVDSIYDPLAENWMVAEALNEGRGIVNYCGHGSVIGWGSSSFDTSWVNNLVNDHMLPFICSAACRTGMFHDRTCFGEVWLRATHAGQPTGAIAAYMASSTQAWAPPMTAQDEAIDLLVADEMRAVGGLWYNGSCRMMDEHGSEGTEVFLTWILFGDPSLAVRTKIPEAMAVTHGDTLFLGQDQYTVTVTGVADALCALYGDGVLYGSARTDEAGQATITIEAPPTNPTPLALTVTAYNKVTYVDDVLVIPTSGPCLTVADVEFLDGNQDGVLNAGETVQMRALLRNNGLDPATGISAAISTASEFVQITVNTLTYPDIPPGGAEWSDGHYTLDIAADCPDEHAVHIPVTFTTDQGPLWNSAIDFTVHAPNVAIAAIAVDDSAAGNGNGTLDPGESGTLTVTLGNAGSYPLGDVTGILNCDHPLIHVIADTGLHPGLDANGEGQLTPPFEIHVDAEFPLHLANCYLAVTGANGYERLLEIPLRVGEFFDNVEGGSGDWNHYPITDGYADQWHISARRNHSPGGSHSWKCGDSGEGEYALLLDAGLETPPLDIGPGAELTFWMWIEAELALSWPDSAYDGGLVELSIDGGPFNPISPIGGYPYEIKLREDPEAGPFPRGTPVFSGSCDWQPVTFELGGTYGTAVLRFRFGSDGEGSREGWYIDDIELIGLASPSDAREIDLVPSRVTLAQSYPNPFAHNARICFALPQKERALLQVFDPTGRLVRTLVSGLESPGVHSVIWTGGDDAGRPAASGVYYYRLNTGSTTLQRSLILLR